MYKEKKIISIDVTFLFDQYSNRGIGRYGKELLKRMIKWVIDENGWELHLLGFLDLRKNLIEIGLTQFSIEEIFDHIKFHSLGTPELSSIKNIISWGKYRQIIEQIEPNVFFAIHFERGVPNGRTTKVSVPIKTALMVHDLIPVINKSYSSKGLIQNQIKKLFYLNMWTGARNADLILAPSDLTKNDLINFADINADKIKRIYHGIDESFYKESIKFDESTTKEVLQRVGIAEDPYFFYDSGLEANKGSTHLLEILSRLFSKASKDIPQKIVITGGGALLSGVGSSIKPLNIQGKAFLNKANQLGILDRIVSSGKVDEDDLRILLVNASGYLYFSDYEGFGFGPVQAMAAEVPTIVANQSCLPEITDGGAFLVDLPDYDNASKEIKKFLQDSESVAAKRQKGLEVVERYDWEKTAEETWNALKSLVPSEVSEYNEHETRNINFS